MRVPASNASSSSEKPRSKRASGELRSSCSGIWVVANSAKPPVPDSIDWVSSVGSRWLAATVTITNEAKATSATLRILRPGLQALLRAAMPINAGAPGVPSRPWALWHHSAKAARPATNNGKPMVPNTIGSIVVPLAMA